LPRELLKKISEAIRKCGSRNFPFDVLQRRGGRPCTWRVPRLGELARLDNSGDSKNQ
jgi:hypothetical protein